MRITSLTTTSTSTSFSFGEVVFPFVTPWALDISVPFFFISTADAVSVKQLAYLSFKVAFTFDLISI